MLDDQEKLNKVLITLNQYLNAGHKLKLTYLKKHDIDGQKVAFDVDDLKNDYYKAVNTWLNEVANYLKPFDFYFYFHFIETKIDTSSINHPLGNITRALERHLHALEDVIVQLEKRKTLTPHEIKDKGYETDILYKITFSDHTREIKLNKMVLANPNSDSKAYNFFEYVYKNPNKPISIKDIEEATAFNLSDSVQDILRDLGFKGSIRKVFFPVAKKDKVLFVNPITKNYAVEHELPIIKLSKDDETEREPMS